MTLPDKNDVDFPNQPPIMRARSRWNLARAHGIVVLAWQCHARCRNLIRVRYAAN